MTSPRASTPCPPASPPRGPRRGRLASIALALALAGGCDAVRPHQSWSYDLEPWGRADAPRAGPLRAPALTADEVERGLADAARARAARADVAASLAPLAPGGAAPAAWSDEAVDEAAERVALCALAGDPARADALVAAHPRLVWAHEPGALALVSAAFAGDALELTVARGPSAGPDALAVCLAPGTYGVPSALGAGGAGDAAPGVSPAPWVDPEAQRRFGRWPDAQDLACLRAPVVVLAADAAVARIRVPVACASFEKAAPEPGRVLALARFASGSAIERLLVELCAGAPRPDAEAQLAVWLARDDVSWAAFVAEGGAWGRLGTFGSGQPVLPHHAPGAARLLVAAGLDPRGRRFWGGAPRPDDAAAPTPAAEAPPASAGEAPPPPPPDVSG